MTNRVIGLVQINYKQLFNHAQVITIHKTLKKILIIFGRHPTFVKALYFLNYVLVHDNVHLMLHHG
jgi:hypothetical protein